MALVTAMALLAASASTVPAKAAPIDALAEIRADVARLDLNAAAAKYDAEVIARLPKAQAGKPDPLLDRMLVEYAAGLGNLRDYASILNRVVANPLSGDGDHYRLFQAKAAEDSAEIDKAMVLYRSIAGDSHATADEKLSAQLGLARQQLTDSPAAALMTIAAIDRTQVPKRRIWEVDLLEGRAEAMAKGDASAAPALSRAWAEAADADPGSGAPARVAGDRAFAAARAGDRSGYLNMLAVDQFNRQAYYDEAALRADLPICGQGGIRPGDRVIVEALYRSGQGIPEISLIWASRAGIARSFLAAVTNVPMPRQSASQTLHLALGCRTAPAIDYQTRGSIDDEIITWMTGQGAYPAMGGSEDNDLFSFASELSRREASYGKDSILLLPELMRIEPIVMSSVDPQNKDSGKRAQEISGRVGDILLAHQAPSALVFGSRVAMVIASVMGQSMTNDEAVQEVSKIMLEAAQDPSTSLDTAYLLAGMTSEAVNAPSELKEQVLQATVDLFRQRAGVGDPRTGALVLKLAALKSEKGDKAGAASLRASLKLEQGLCAMTDPQPRFSSSNIVSSDYPSELIFASIAGHTALEFDLDSIGRAINSRVILSDPPYAFDRIALERAPTIRYDVGNSHPCRAMVQNVMWRMPEPD
jgi:hypothetical protein